MATEALHFDAVQPGTSEGDLYSPGAGYTTLTQVILVNTSASGATVTIGRGSLNPVDQLIPGVTVPAKTVETLDMGGLRINVGETLRALQNTSGAITVWLCGYTNT